MRTSDAARHARARVLPLPLLPSGKPVRTADDHYDHRERYDDAGSDSVIHGMHSCRKIAARGLTFDMSGSRKQAKLAGGRPLDGGVKPLVHWDGELSGDVCSGTCCVLRSPAMLCGACSSSVTRRRRTNSSSISSRPIRARPTANRPIASAPTATAPTAIAPSANPPTASAPAANAPRALGAAPIVRSSRAGESFGGMRCEVWLGRPALDIAMRRYS
jgi:hypothetical protein